MGKKIFILVGASGSGKTTLGNYLKSIGIPELVSHTTRAMREGEVDGISYNFISKEDFVKIEKVEHAEYSGNYYCLSKKEVDEKLSQSDNVFAVTELKGLEQIKERYPEETVSIFIKVTLDEMVERMKARGDSKENIANRVSNAILNDELDNEYKCDYSITNDSLDKSKLVLEKIVKLESKINKAS